MVGGTDPKYVTEPVQVGDSVELLALIPVAKMVVELVVEFLKSGNSIDVAEVVIDDWSTLVDEVVVEVIAEVEAATVVVILSSARVVFENERPPRMNLRDFLSNAKSCA